MSDLLPSGGFMLKVLLLRAAPFVFLEVLLFLAYSWGVHDANVMWECKNKGGHLLRGECVKEVK